jgi:hypothetical protein
MEDLSCPRATRVVRSITGKEELRDKNEVKELPTNLTRRCLYRRWLWRRGFIAKTDGFGIMTTHIPTTMDTPESIDWQVDDEASPTVPLTICSWPTFFYFWKRIFQSWYFQVHDEISVIHATFMLVPTLS